MDREVVLDPLVADLVKVVARTFYRDEYVVVMDTLTRMPFVRDDDLGATFGIPDQQARRILNDLKAEYMVFEEREVVERKKKRVRGQEVDTAKLAAEYLEKSMNPSGKKKKSSSFFGDAEQSSSSEDDDSSSSSDEEDRLTAKATVNKYGKVVLPRKKRTGRVKSNLWYINPRWFVDAVKYRLYVVTNFLDKLQSAQENGAMYACSVKTCDYECSMLEAQHHKVALRSMAAAAGGTATTSSTAEFTCARCEAPLVMKHTENIGKTATHALRRFNDLVAASGIKALLARLDAVPLGARRPSDLIRSELVTMRAPEDAKPLVGGAGAGGGGSGGGGGGGGSRVGEGGASSSSSSGGAPRSGPIRGVFVRADNDIKVKLEGEEDADADAQTEAARHIQATIAAAKAQGAQNVGIAAPRAAAAAPAGPVAVKLSALPDHLRRAAAAAGDDVGTLGFLQVTTEDGSGGAGGSGAGEEGVNLLASGGLERLRYDGAGLSAAALLGGGDGAAAPPPASTSVTEGGGSLAALPPAAEGKPDAALAELEALLVQVASAAAPAAPGSTDGAFDTDVTGEGAGGGLDNDILAALFAQLVEKPDGAGSSGSDAAATASAEGAVAEAGAGDSTGGAAPAWEDVEWEDV